MHVKIRQSRTDRVFDGFNILFMCIIVLVMLYPLIYVLSASFSDPMDVLSGRVFLLPKNFNLRAYEKVFNNASLLQGYWNTICYTVVGTCINLVMTIAGAYPLSRKDLYGRNVIMIVIVFTMYFSGGMIPTYLIIKQLNLIDKFWVMVLPNAIVTTNLIVMRTFFRTSIPDALFEAAEIDGASSMRTLFKLVLPLSLPIIAVQVLFYAVGHWNAYFNALIYLTSRSKYPLQMVLREIIMQNQVSSLLDMSVESVTDTALLAESIKYAAIVIASAPVLALYPVIQKYFTKGVMLGAIKG